MIYTKFLKGIKIKSLASNQMKIFYNFGEASIRLMTLAHFKIEKT